MVKRVQGKPLILCLVDLLQSPHCSLMVYWASDRGHSEGTMRFESELAVAAQRQLTVKPRSLKRENMNLWESTEMRDMCWACTDLELTKGGAKGSEGPNHHHPSFIREGQRLEENMISF